MIIDEQITHEDISGFYLKPGLPVHAPLNTNALAQIECTGNFFILQVIKAILDIFASVT